MQKISHGPGFHWFGYYDKWQTDPSDRYLLSNRVAFEGRQPMAAEAIQVGMFDLQRGNAWIELGESRAWSWQQGAMLQWLPGSETEVIWNDLDASGYVSHILDTRTMHKRTLPAPIYSVSPDGKQAVHPDFRRLNDLRPGYGYAALADPNADVRVPTSAGNWHLDLQTGAHRLPTALADLVQMPGLEPFPESAWHWTNHLLFSPSGERFVFLHRYSEVKNTMWKTRLITMRADGSDAYILNPHGMTSHFIWRDAEHILAWAYHPSAGNRFYLFRDKTEEVTVIGRDVLTQDGHCSYLPRHRSDWIVNDTYPDESGLQHVHLFHVPTETVTPLASLHSPPAYVGPWRCDTHPRCSRDGTQIFIDSAHEGGRQIYAFSVGDIVGPPRE